MIRFLSTKITKQYKYFSETDIKEVFIKGSGPGGQKVNKSNNKVQLTHLPTNIVISCHQFRSQEENRKRARKLLDLKLEEIEDPNNSRLSAVHQKIALSKLYKKKKTNKKYAKIDEERRKLKEEEKERENLDQPDEFDVFLESLKKDN